MAGRLTHYCDVSDVTNKSTTWLIKEYQKDPSNELYKMMLVKRYENLVRTLAVKYSKSPQSNEDMFQVAMIGLIKAIKRYDPGRGNPFKSYAIPTITGELKRYLRDHTWSVSVPRRYKEQGTKLLKIIDTLTEELQRSPQINEIAERIDMKEEEVLQTLEAKKNYNAVSIDFKPGHQSDGSGLSLLEKLIRSDCDYYHLENKLLLEKLLTYLDEREQKVVKYLYFQDLNQTEVGRKIGVSQMHVSRLHRAALAKLRKKFPLEKLELK